MIKESIESTINSIIEESYNPLYVELVNESFMHNVPKDSESHFKLIIVSDIFKDKTVIERHKIIYAALDSYIKSGEIHALTIKSLTIDESNNT